jgi:uncharacterized membrane protein
VLTLTAFLMLDSIWLTLAAAHLYRPGIGHLMRADFDLGAAALFYLLYTAAMLYFAVLPSRSWRVAVLRGALFGLTAYATYDLTNQATLRDWPWHVTLIDLIWGTFVTAATCGVTHALTQPRAR